MSLLTCLWAAIPARDRVVTCEKAFELLKMATCRAQGAARL
jgi:hypothetical protein